MDLILPKRKRHSWSLGLVAVMTGTYVTGGYWLMPETIYESHGFYSGAMSYAGIRITRQFEFGREKVE